MAALGVGGHPVGRDQRAVQAEEGQAGGARMGQHGAQGGSVRGDHVERFVQVAVGGGDADPGVCGQGAHIQTVAQPAQRQHDLSVHRADPLRRTGPRPTAVPGDPAGHRLQHRCGHIQAGTMRHSGLPGKRRSVFGESIFNPESPRPVLPPRPRPATTSVKPAMLVRKPH